MKYVILDEKFSVKGDKKNRFLFNIETGKKYNLNKIQFKIIKLSVGDNTINQITKKSGISEAIVELFLHKMKEVGAIKYQEKKQKRRVVYITDGKQLKVAQWEITNLCNLKCLHCYQLEYLRREKDIDLYNCKKIIQEMADLGIERVLISGGEPLMRNDLIKILRLLEEKNIKTEAIFTNGILISNKFLKQVKCLKSRIRFNISLDGISYKSLKIRGFVNKQSQQKYLDKVIKNIILIRDNKFSIRITTIINKSNYLEIGKMYEKLSNIGNLSWSIGFPREMGSCIINKEYLLADMDIILLACRELIRIHLDKIHRRENTINLKIQNLFHERFINNLNYYSVESYICNYENKESLLCIKPNGDVLPCSVFFNYVFGNVKKESLYKIWNSQQMRKLRGMKIRDLNQCRKCKFMNLCGGGCRANASIQNKNIKSKDLLACKLMNFFFKEIKPLFN